LQKIIKNTTIILVVFFNCEKMATYNLDHNEEVDSIKINGVWYEVGDIPYSIIVKIRNIKTGMFDKSLDVQWRPIIKEILEIKNKDVNVENLTKDKVFWFIKYLKRKLGKWQIW